MTHLSAAAYAIDALGRDTAPSSNPEQDLARLAQAEGGTGGLLAWLRGTSLVRALAAHRAERDLNRAVARLAETSPHLLADIGILDAHATAPDMAVSAHRGSTEEQVRLVASPVPVAVRPAYRPAIAAPRTAPAPAAAKGPIAAAQKDAVPAH